ncbi:Protein EMSY-LIKE 3 [Bienertia sinuspersici]
MLGSGPYRRVQGDMEHQIHHLEKEAYFASFELFKAQSDAISWDKEGLITELRKELRVSDDEHREVLVRVNNDDIICRIREWRKGDHQTLSTSHPINDLSSTTPSSRKKQRTVQSLPTHGAPPSTGAGGPRGRKPRQFPYSNHSALESTMPGRVLSWLEGKVLTRWPDDNHFYEAVISRYNASDIPSEDIRWVNEDPGLSHGGGPGDKRTLNHIGAVPSSGRKQYRAEIQNGTGNMTDDIEILHTDTLIKEVEKVVAASNPDRHEIEKAKKMLKEHEQALLDAISRLTYVSDGDSGNKLPYRYNMY